MILYVNGDSHTAAAEAVSSCCFAEDDGNYLSLGRRPHPSNLEVSWGLQLAKLLNWEFYCDAESASSNDRIIRTTQEWIRNNYDKLDRVFMVIQWSTWEREEWEYGGQTWQVNASGIDQVPPELQTRYKEFVANVDWKTATQQAHNKIWHLHNELKNKKIRHVFFNGNNHFADQPNHHAWGLEYMHPYMPMLTYDRVLKANGFRTVTPKSWHFGPAAHDFWASYVLQYMHQHQLLEPDALSVN